jgi:ribonuclease G
VPSEETIAIDVKRRLRKVIAGQSGGEAVLIEVHPLVAAAIIGPKGSGLKKWERETGTSLLIRGREEFHIEHVRILEIGDRKTLIKKAVPLQAGEVCEVLVDDIHQHQPGDGIARINGFVITVEQGADYIGKQVAVEILKIYPTHALAKLTKNIDNGFSI